MPGQLGLEKTREEYVGKLVEVFREVRRVLADDGTAWINLGDSYSGYHGNSRVPDADAPSNKPGYVENMRATTVGVGGLKPKDLVGIPWRVAFALQSDGWYLRSDIIWHKPNPMPESVTDRPTKSHEYLFLLSKQARYYYNAAAIAEPLAESSVERLGQPNLAAQRGSDRVPGKTNGTMKAVARKGKAVTSPRHDGNSWNENNGRGFLPTSDERNARTVWTIPTTSYKGAHFATFPEELARRCILAGSAPGDTVLDPFSGSGTVAQVATGNGRSAIGIELNPAYMDLARERIGPLLCEVA